MSSHGPRLLSLRTHVRHAWRHVCDWLIMQGEYLAIGRSPITLSEVESDHEQYKAEYRHVTRERNRMSIFTEKSNKTVTVSAEWKRHRDDYIKTGSLASFRHMVESVTVKTITGDPNDTPTATR